MENQVNVTLGRVHQYIAVLTCCILVCVYGIGMAWVSYSIRMLNTIQSASGGNTLTNIDISILGSIPNLGAIIISVPAGTLIQKFGTKKCGVAIGVIMIMAWFLKICSNNIYLIFIARLLLGISGGFGMMNVTMFIPEIAETAIRGTLSTSIAISLTTGMLLSYILGATFDYRVINIIVVAIPLMYTLGFCFIYESPVFLLKNKREKEAAKSMAWYRGASVDSTVVIESLDAIRTKIIETKKSGRDELQGIRSGYEAHEEQEETEILQQNQEYQKSTFENGNEKSGWKYFKSSPSSRRALFSALLLFLLQSFMGFIIVTTFAGEIIREAAPSISPGACSILIGVFTLVGSIISMFLIEKTGRKMLMIVTSLIVSVFLVILAVLIQTSFGPGWLPAGVLCLYVVTFSLGPGTVPFVWVAELFLPQVRGFSTAICMQAYSVIVCVCLALFPPLKSLVGVNGMFYVFSVFSLITATFTFFIFPETKGLTVEEIHVHFGAKTKKSELILIN